MAGKFLDIALTPPVLDAQAKYFGQARPRPRTSGNDSLGPDEISFIHARDSFYMATVMPNDWPYVQHRGGKPGFLHVCDPSTLAFADYRGNRQMISTGNISANDRVALFLMDYPNRERLKILGHARVEDAGAHPKLAAELADPEAAGDLDRIFLIDVVAFDWNCPQYITPRYTAAEIGEMARNQATPEEA